ncbi:MAG TPA: tetratricopeptide repeat protein, partial [Gemmataceae bacterium]|nr:tetratricopeptide repeat protein [Gemmataceae bacterium]
MVSPTSVDSADDLVLKAKAALANGKVEEALKLADQAIAADDKNAQAYVLRGFAQEVQEKHAEAIADFTKAITLDPKTSDAYFQRGCEHFKLAHIKESIVDFDKYLELRPDQVPELWQRGIAYYYASRYEDGQKQFEVHQKVNPNDVENAVWRYLCMAKTVGVEKARESLLKIDNDQRVPMMTIYDLFRGHAKAEDVLKVANAGKPSANQLKKQLFYAHLYIGLYHEAAGENEKALRHLQKA